MKHRIGKILTTIGALILSVFMFAGCNLIQVNNAKYYKQKVVAVKVKEDKYSSYAKTYTKKDLLNAYYNYAYQYVSQGQLSVKEGVDYAINNMINSDLLFNYIKEEYYNNEKYDLDFTDADKNDARLSAFDSMQQSIFEIEKEVIKEWDVDITEELADDEEKKTLRAEYTPYTPSVEVIEINGKEIIVLNEKEDYINDSRVAPAHFTQEIRDAEVSKEAFTRYVKQLQDAAKAEGRSTKQNEVLLYEEERLIDVYVRNIYLTKFEKWYNKYYNFTYDSANKVYVLNEDIQNKIVANYKEEFLAQKDKYNANDGKLYHEAMAGSDISSVYYHHNSGNEYVYISHILLKFSDAQVKQIAEYDDKLKRGLITQERYDELVAQIADQTKVTYEQDGKTLTSTAASVYETISGYVNTGDSIITDPIDPSLSDEDKMAILKEKEAAIVAKAKRFNDMIYIYNDDEGIMNKDYSYVVNIDTNVEDKMVKPFADKAREMHADGIMGAVSDMVITEYGVHILFYGGEVKNVVEDINTLTAIDLIKHRTQLSSDKNLFAIAYDKLTNDAYNKSINNYIADCLKFVEIVKYTDKYKDLYK